MTVPFLASLVVQQAPGFAIGPTVFMYGALIAIFYFVLIRPQQKQRKAHEALIRTVKRGDEIVTAGGIVGEVVNVAAATKDGTADGGMGDRITIKSGESRLIVERGRIARVNTTSTPAV